MSKELRPYDTGMDDACTSTRTQQGRFTWVEISKHNNKASCWVVVHGKVYDVTDFISQVHIPWL